MKWFALNAALLLALFSHAQNTRITDKNTIGWFNQFATLQFNKKWSAHLEYQWRREDVVRTWQQGLFRTGINYQANNRLQLRAGYAFIETFPYGDYPLQAAGKTFPEHRLFQAATLTDALGRVEFSHRLMLEQRWIGRYTQPELTKVDDYVFINRMRYQLRMQMPLNRPKMEDNTLYAALFDEIFVGFGENINENVFDQNRLSFMVGYRFNKYLRTEAGYLQQIVQLGREINGRNVFQYNNGVIVNAYYTLNLQKGK